MRQYACNTMNFLASNDEQFFKERNRSLPIPQSICSIPNYPTKLRIFLTNASRYWQVKCFFEGKTICRSLRTTSKRDAIALAKQFYEVEILRIGMDWLTTDRHARKTHSIDLVGDMLIAKEQARANRDEIAQLSVKVTSALLRKHVIPYFKKMPVEKITSAQVNAFYNYLSNLHLSTISISQYLTIVKKSLAIALENQWLDVLPHFPNVKKTSTSRGGFTLGEYWQILRTAQRLRKIVPPVKPVTHRNTKNGIYTATDGVPYEMVWLIRFMVNSFVRPVDIKVIQHQHVEIVRGEHAYLRLSLPETKRHKAQIITLPAAVQVYEKLRDYFAVRGLAKPTDYLFMPQVPNRADAMPLLEGYFKKIMIDTGLRLGSQGQKRTLYSLRHSSITFRLLYGKGIDMLTLARNARTSIEMIDKHYASELTAEMNVGMLHSRR